MSTTVKDYIVFASILLGVFIGIYLLNLHSKSKTKFEDAALGKETIAYYYSDDYNNKIHFDPKLDFNSFLEGIKMYKEHRKILFIGNSQSHSINQFNKGDNTMSGYLFNRFLEDSIAFISTSVPNANIQEQYLLFSMMSENLDNLKTLVLPVFMDDLRESGIREAYFKQFKNYAISDSNELSVEINSKLKTFNVNRESANNSNYDNDNKALQNTVQESVEKYLNELLANNLSFWNGRKEVRGKLFMFLYKLRNTVFGISAQTKRRMIPIRYKKNFTALELMLISAKEKGIDVLLLIPPIRQDIETPYVDLEYSTFKNNLNELAGSYNIKLLDIDKIVEGKYWGYTDPIQLFSNKGYDFMHFQSEGHRVMADTLEHYILKNYNL